MTPQEDPFSGIESPFFWPVGLALSMEKELVHSLEKNIKFFQEIVTTEIIRPKPEWASPNAVVLDIQTLTLRHFFVADASPSTPTLVLPPYAGHTSTIADFHQGQSLVATLAQNGVKNIFVTEWRSATLEMKDLDIDNYLAELLVVVDHLGGRVNLIGLCQGGWMASIFAARFPAKVAALVCAGSPLDTQAGNGQIRDLAADLPMAFYEGLVRAGGGLMKGEFMLEGFKNMHPSEHMVDKYVRLYEHIDDPRYVARNETFERWYETTVNLPGKWYLQAIQQLFKENRFAAGTFVALGVVVDAKSIECPLYLLAGASDDITPADQVFNATRFFGTASDRVTKELADGGHIGLFMGSKALQSTWPKIAAWLLSLDTTTAAV